jgi:large subunit ribosomal protein L13
MALQWYPMKLKAVQKTFSAKTAEVQRQWLLVDADGLTLGRLASELAKRLRGKHKPEYTPHVDTGDFVIVINADKIKVTGRKRSDKIYYHHTGFPGGIKSSSYEQLLEKRPDRPLELAVKRMIPRTSLGRAMLKKLKIYAGPDHPHQAQCPTTITLPI